jgi:pimeloyl-ACP methyl ester carboxylesterase
MGTFVLVHGAWHGRWCWERLEHEMRARGHTTVSMDLPVSDGTATFLDYRDAVLSAWPDMEPTESSDLVLVGHSLGAMVVPLVAARRSVAHSVFVCPVVPNVSGMPWDDAPEMGAPGAYVTAQRPDGSVVFDHIEEAVFTFYGSCSRSDANWAFERLQPQNSASLWDRPYPMPELPPGRRTVIAGRHDQAITPAFLETVCPSRLGTTPRWLDADHSPFLSDVRGLADLLEDLPHFGGDPAASTPE